MANKRRVQRLITVLVLPVNLAPSPGHSSIACLITGPAAQHYVCLSVLYLDLSRGPDTISTGETQMSFSAVGRTSCILPDFVYLAVCVHCSHPLIFSNCVVLSRGLFSGKWKLLMFINILDMHLNLNIYFHVALAKLLSESRCTHWPQRMVS